MFYISDEGNLYNTYNFTEEEIKEVEREIKKYCEENSTYYEGYFYSFWNGSKWRTILISTDNGDIVCDFEVLTDEEAEGIINDYHTSEFVEEVCGISYYQGKQHKYSVSRWERHPWCFEVED